MSVHSLCKSKRLIHLVEGLIYYQTKKMIEACQGRNAFRLSKITIEFY